MKASTKDWFQYGSAVGMLVSGIVLTFISFFERGDVTNNVLVYVGEALTFAGAIFGIALYANHTVKREVGREFDKLRKGKEASGKE